MFASRIRTTERGHGRSTRDSRGKTRPRFIRAKWGTNSPCFHEARIGTGFQPLFGRTTAVHYLTVTEGHAVTRIMCVAHFGAARPQTSPAISKATICQDLTAKVDFCNYKKLHFAPHGSFPLITRAMVTAARLLHACLEETARKPPIYREAEKTENVSE